MTQDRNVTAFTARSVVASLLLGSRPPALPSSRLVAAAGLFGVGEGTARVALSRMVSAGELQVGDGRYRLAGPLLARYERQEAGRRPATVPWDGGWLVAVVGVGGARPPSARAELRRSLVGRRLAEWREGLWARPDNLPGAGDPLAGCTWLRDAHPEDSGALAATLWDAAGWAATAESLLAQLRRLRPDLDRRVPGPGPDAVLGEAFEVAASTVRHLRDDPLLPPDLLPPDWPGPTLRVDYDRFEAAFQRALRPVLARR